MIEVGMDFSNEYYDTEVTGISNTSKFTYIDYIRHNKKSKDSPPVFGSMVIEEFKKKYKA